MAKGKRTPLDVKKAIEDIAAKTDTSARAIIDRLSSDPRFRGRVPEERTVQAIIRPYRRERIDPSARWTLRAVDPRSDGARYVLDALAAIDQLSGGKISSVSNDEAALIERVARARPDMPPIEWWGYARKLSAAGTGDTTDIELELARGWGAVYETQAELMNRHSVNTARGEEDDEPA